jgi:hypothetical protein
MEAWSFAQVMLFIASGQWQQTRNTIESRIGASPMSHGGIGDFGQSIRLSHPKSLRRDLSMLRSTRPFLICAAAACVALNSMLSCRAGVNYEEDPINYSKTEPSNPVTELQRRIDAARASLAFEGEQGYLKSLLKSLEIPITSQVMTFAKTSLQAHHISPSTPRALYFNDDIHVGYVQEGMIEIAVSDPRLGMAFYTLEQVNSERPRFQHTLNCLTCHGAARTRNVPGLQIRSVFPDPKGQPVIAASSLRTDHSSPFEKRWGGWYVTGRHGTQQHLGNFLLSDGRKPKAIDNSAGQNVTDLSSRLETSRYLSPHSDLVALLVLEHQTDAHNLLTLASFETRHALHLRGLQRQDPNSAAEDVEKSAQDRIAKSGEALVRYLLFSGEARLTGPVEGTSDFARDFASRGPFDGQGRSLRQFDLTRRIFKYPCSYLIYSNAFDSLPIETRQYVFRRFRQVLSAEDATPEFDHLSRLDRQAILEILQATKPEFAALLRNPASVSVESKP